MYRPLYMFGNNTNATSAINYPLSPAEPAGVLRRRQDRRGHHEGLEVVQRRDRGRQDLMFFMNMVEAEKANWYAYSPGLLPDNVVSYKATGPNQAHLPPQQVLLQHLVHLQPAG